MLTTAVNFFLQFALFPLVYILGILSILTFVAYLFTGKLLKVAKVSVVCFIFLIPLFLNVIMLTNNFGEPSQKDRVIFLLVSYILILFFSAVYFFRGKKL